MPRKRAVAYLILSLTILCPSGSGEAQPVAGATFFVGRGTFGGHLQDVDVAPGTDGSFVVIWGDYNLDVLSGSGDHAATRRFAEDGTPLGPPVRVDTSGHVFSPVIAADGRGGYVAAWEWIGRDYLFFGQLLGALGLPAGKDFEVTLNLPGWPIVAGTAVGAASGPTFLWFEANALWARTVDGYRDRLGGDINLGPGGYRLDAARLPDGGFVTAWSDAGESDSALRFIGPTGQPRGALIPVQGLFYPHVAASPRGEVAAVGPAVTTDPNVVELQVRRFTPDGDPIGEPLHVRTPPPRTYLFADVEFDAIGNLYVVWTEYLLDQGQALAPQARAYDLDGNPLGTEVAISTEPGVEIRAVRLGNGTFANVWYWRGEAWGVITRLCEPGTSVCGDGVHVAACEQCDDGAANSDSAPDACRSDCTRARCGDGAVDTAEQCDDGNARSCDGCDERCQTEAGSVCGDGVRAGSCGEHCDEGVANNDLLPDACRSDCSLARCGDGVVDSGEQCDDGNVESCDGCSSDCLDEGAMADADGNGNADACDSCGEFLDPAGASAPRCAPAAVPRLTDLQIERFEEGLSEFLQVEAAPTGLGPVFNGAACAECHSIPVIGGSSPRTVTRIGAIAADGFGFDPLAEYGGPLLQERGITTGACSVAGEIVPPEATFVSRRQTPALFGAGLMEAISDLDIRLRSDSTDRNEDGISGRYNVVGNRVGRFGWKAQVATVHDFSAEAYLEEMGITTPFRPVENAPQGGPVTCDSEAEPEDDGAAVGAFTDFLVTLAPPTRARLSAEARLGRRVFRSIGCQKCHFAGYGIRDFPVHALRRRRVALYSDLLLHDMGPALADGIRQGSASGSEWRTPPLWGVRHSAPYLHDGRAASLEEAIVLHGGEGTAARSAYLALPGHRRVALIRFLESL
jgi:cysteine-rich repeat protein